MTGGDLTILIEHARQGNLEAENQLCERIYGELHDMARRIMSHDDTSLQPTMLVDDLFAKFFRKGGLKKTVNRRYFFAVAANQMRNMLTDHYRRQSTQRRGGDRKRESLDVVLDSVLSHLESGNGTDIESLNEALRVLKKQNEKTASGGDV